MKQEYDLIQFSDVSDVELDSVDGGYRYDKALAFWALVELATYMYC